jgi:hypothetical protein
MPNRRSRADEGKKVKAYKDARMSYLGQQLPPRLARLRIKCNLRVGVLFLACVLFTSSASAQTKTNSFNVLIGCWAIDKDACSPGTHMCIRQSSINLFDEVQCQITKRVQVAKPNAWLLDLRCQTVDQGGDVRQSLLILGSEGDLYDYSRGEVEHRIKCP